MAIEPGLCYQLRYALGSEHWLVVVGFSNGEAIRRAGPIPLAAIAWMRFQAAVVASRTDWVAAGWLTEGHVAMILPALPDDLDDSVRASLARFAFPHFWKGVVTLEAVVVSVRCDEADSVDGLLAVAASKVAALGGPVGAMTPRYELVGSCVDGPWEDIVAIRRAAAGR